MSGMLATDPTICRPPAACVAPSSAASRMAWAVVAVTGCVGVCGLEKRRVAAGSVGWQLGGDSWVGRPCTRGARLHPHTTPHTPTPPHTLPQT